MKRLVQLGTAREVKARVLVDGKALTGAVSAEVTSNAHYQADRWRVEFALNALDGRDLNWWGSDDRKGELYDVRMTANGEEVSFILGEADEIRIHPATGTVETSGRDLTARFIDNRIQEAFLNRTASEVVTILAKRRGLIPKIKATTTLVARYYGDSHDRVSQGQFSTSGAEWDLMTRLAQNEGFDLYVTGRELHFEPAVDPKVAEPFRVKWDADARKSDVTNLNLGRSLTLAKDVVVLVKSWHSGKGKSFTKTSPGSGGGVQAGKAQRYFFTRPNLTEDETQKLADSIRADLTKRERTISFACPGELELTSRDILDVRGVGGWSQIYFVDTVTRRISFDGGFAQNVTAKNHSVESAAAQGGGQPLTEGQA